MAVVLGGRGGERGQEQNDTGYEKIFNCDTKDPENQTAATILISLGSLGVGANLALMAVILLRRPLRRSEKPIINNNPIL